MTSKSDRELRVGTSARITLLACALIALVIAGCAAKDSRSSGLLEPYRVDLPQGNYLTREMVAQVKPGMTPDQVRLALGSPLLIDVFRPDRWVYVFRYQHPSGEALTRRATVFFRDDRVERIDAQEMPGREDPNDPALPGFRPKTTGAK